MSDFLFRGLTTFLSGKYNETLLSNLENLRNKFQCTLPVEIWHNGELEEELKEKLSKLENINFMNVNNFVSNPEKWNEESLKSVMMFYSDFQEMIVFNDNVVFHLDPFYLVKHEGYSNASGMVLFSYVNKSFSINEKYVEFAKKIVDSDSDNFPVMQKYIFTNTLDDNQREYFIDNNVMLINRTIHINVISKLLKHYQEMYKNDEIYVPAFHDSSTSYNDRFAFGSKKSMAKYCTRYDHMKEYAAKQQLHSETFLKYVIKTAKKTNIKFNRIRANGKTDKRDL